MATIGDLPRVLLYHIIFLVVRSTLGAVDLARIVSVCRDFFAFADDERLLKVISFDSRMDYKTYCKYQHINGLLVKCSKVGNISAQFLLGKVIVFSSTRLLLSEQRNWYVVARLGQSIATDVYCQRIKDISFVKYFLPTEASTSESSQTRLVHYQLVKVLLRNISHRDVLAMEVYLKSYLTYFGKHSGRNYPLLNSLKFLVSFASDLRALEKMVEMKQEVDDLFWYLRGALDVKSRHYLEAVHMFLYHFDQNFD